MDFPVCPSCHQSVLDDDAVDCPFCGTSMKAKPSAKPAPAAPKPGASPSKSTTTGTPVKPPTGKAPGKPTLPGDDFPFDVELTAGKTAILGMPGPSKQRSLKLVCPMCDTPSYFPPNVAGKEVKCCNAKCVMPVFTAPSAKKKEDALPPPPPPKSSNLPLMIGMTVVLMAVIGGGLYVFNLLPGSARTTPKVVSEDDKKAFEEFIGKKKSDPVKAGPVVPAEKAPTEKNAKPEVKVEDLIKIVLKQMRESSLDNIKNRSKPYCRQLSAEANAVTGHANAAYEDLDQLLKVGAQFTYYRINPLLELFWAATAANDKKAAQKALNTAMTEVSKVPKFGRTRLEIAGRLAAALAGAGRIPEAAEVLDQIAASDTEVQEAQLAARLQIVTDGRIGSLSESYSVLPWKFPQAVAATASLITRGQLDQALNWASSQSSDEAKAECLAIWAQQLARDKAAAGSADAGGAIAAAIKSLSPALAARVWARAGCGRLAAQDQAGIDAAIKLAQEQLAQIHAPEALILPKLAQMHRFKLPTTAPQLVQAATAAGEIASLQARSAGKLVDAEKSLDVALAFLDATAPSLPSAQERDEEADGFGINLPLQLKKEWRHLKNEDDARVAAREYKRKLNTVVDAARLRFDFETQLLSHLRAASAGLNTKVWIVVDSRTSADEIHKRDNFFDTGLPGELVEGLKGTDQERAIQGAWTLRTKGAKGNRPARPVAVEFQERLQSDIPGAVQYIEMALQKSTRRDEILLESVSELVTADQLSIAFEFIAALDDGVMREECYRLAASLASDRGVFEPIWKQVALVQQQTEKIALCRGLIAGLKEEVE